MTAGPLARFTVLDLTRVRAGPTAVRYLADWGANCIKVEMPPGAGDMDMGGPRHGPDFQNLHRNKRSITLNLKEAEGKAIFMKLVEKADVVVENYRADVKFRLGIDYESLKKVNPRIVLGSISGFGQDGPYAERAGFDQIAQGMGGLMWVTGMPGGGPVRAGIAVADVGAGLHCAIGILTALLEREVSGQGQWVSSSLLQAMISMCDFQAARWTIAHDVPAWPGTSLASVHRAAWKSHIEIIACSSELDTHCPSPDFSRSSSAIRIPMAQCRPAPTSATAMPARTGPPPAGPVTHMMPPMPWAIWSKPARLA